MASLNSVKILEVCQVAPAKESGESATGLSLPLTFYDARFFRSPPAERIYFYKLTASSSTFFHSQILPLLKHALSQTLLHFLPVAGKLTWPSHSSKTIIVYAPDDAVSLTVAESCADFNRLVSNEIREVAESRPYVPELLASDAMASIIALQITLFPNKGFSIGIAMNHAALDGKSASMFLKAWAHLCKQSDNGKIIPLLPELIPSFDRASIKDPDGLEQFYLNHRRATPGFDSESNPRSMKILPNILGVSTNLVRCTFQLSRESIQKIREHVLSCHQSHAGLKSMENLHLSTLVVTSSYVSVCLVKARGGDSSRRVYIFVPADCRSRIDPSIPSNYFGNCVYVLYTVVEAGILMEKNGVAIAAEKLSDLIKGLNKGVFQGAKERDGRWMAEGAEMQMIGIMGSPKFKYYEEDFGWGRPEKVENSSIYKITAVSLMEDKDGNGVQIGLVLPRHEMEAFASLFLQGLPVL
ncbi:hypothetical protein P3X46_029671 [Hevea brasiliensis]|uniref:BAHD acyltransferase n=1 Tax=Hevea brasiliensis TaxID=3981 RepID=A0ABQ9KSX8_HEVBR|nr:phenolic glucoside malonyltransferase 1-like [Hevea brasiliensis]KAJ9147518.1 hypothetical protein P3X46_029671 [Hevea brasiliensis]